MKKVLAMFLSICFVFCLTACGQDKTAGDVPSDNLQSTSTENLTSDSTESGNSTEVDNPSDTSNPDSDSNPSSSDNSDGTNNPSDTNNSNGTNEPDGSSKPNSGVHTHNYSNATCTEAPKCSCGATEGGALGHSFSNATCTEAKKCSRCGATEGNVLGHSYSDATCTEAKKCSRCGATDGSALGHSYSDATCTEAKKCSRCGTTDGNALGHKWQEGTCKVPKICSVCKITDGTTADHSFNSQGECKWCRQILPISSESIKNREYEIYKPSANSNEIIGSFSLCFDLCGASIGEYLTCSEVYGSHCPNPEGHITYGGKNYHCVGGSGLIPFTQIKLDRYVVVTITELGLILTLEVFSNDTLKVVSISGELQGVNLIIGDVFQ